MATSERMGDGGPAFPCDDLIVQRRHLPSSQGMTLRDFFAAKAMAAMIPLDMPSVGGMDSVAVTAAASYEMADAMLAARSKP